MSRRRYDLPSLKMIGTFEAAARAGSFKDAADELGVTPGAVSHQVRGLEADLGMELFIRQARTVELSVEGRVLFDVVHRSMARLTRHCVVCGHCVKQGKFPLGRRRRFRRCG